MERGDRNAKKEEKADNTVEIGDAREERRNNGEEGSEKREGRRAKKENIRDEEIRVKAESRINMGEE